MTRLLALCPLAVGISAEQTFG